MKEVQVVSLDDMFLAEGRRVPADGTVTLAYNSTTVELDLTTGNREELEAKIADYLKVGHKPEKPPAVSRRTPAGGYRHAPGRRAYNTGMREWANERMASVPALREVYTYVTPGGGYYLPKRLREDYAAYLEAGS